MSFSERKDLVFGSERISYAILYISFALFFITVFTGKYLNWPKELSILGSLIYFLIAWLIVRKVQKRLTCQNCHMDLNSTILALTKNSQKGFCPKCGNEIT